MNSVLNLFAAVLFVLWDRCRLLRGAWKRGEWRNLLQHTLLLGAFLSVIGGALALPLWLIWKFA